MKLIHIIIVLLISVWGTYGTYTYMDSVHSLVVPSDISALPQAVDDSETRSKKSLTLVDVEQDLTSIIEQITPSVVNIYASKNVEYIYDRSSILDRLQWLSDPEVIQQRLQLWWGSGILVSRSGYILTNKHVVEDPDAEYEVQFSDGRSAISQQARLDPKLDIAVLKIDPEIIGDTKVATFTNFDDTLDVGQFAIAIWNALAEFGHSVTLWVISAMNRTISLDGSSIYAGLIQTDTSISQGNSGGPLFDSTWEVIGINTAVSAVGENIWFALPVTQQFVDATLDSIINTDAIIRPFVGIWYIDLDGSTANDLWLDVRNGVYISEVVPWSSADQVWLEPDDILMSMNGVEITVGKPFMYHLYTYTPGDIVDIQYIRDGIRRSGQITFWTQ